MRVVVVMLLLANLAFAGYAWLDRWLDRRASTDTLQQVQPDKIKLLTPQQAAALVPDKPDVCIEWGPFADNDRTRALADLEPLALGRLLTQRRLDPQPKAGATMLVIRDPSNSVVARLRELAPNFPSADVKAAVCAP